MERSKFFKEVNQFWRHKILGCASAQNSNKRFCRKRGLSSVITIMIFILLSIVAITIIWIIVANLISEQSEVIKFQNKLFSQNLKIKKVEGNLTNPDSVNITIFGGSGKITLKNISEIEKSGDIVFVVDSTGSMKDEITDVQNRIFDFVDKLKEDSIDYRLGLIDFQDYDGSPCGSNSYMEYSSQVRGFSSGEFTNDENEYKSEITSIINSMGNIGVGGDIPESHLTAIEDSINLDYRADATKFVVLISDAPPHSKDCNYPKNILDIAIVTDRSGSMFQSGWTLNTTLSPIFEQTVSVPLNDYSSSYSFNVPAGTSRLAVGIDWDRTLGVNGSEGSEFAHNLKRPSGEWIYGNSRPNVGGIVDPPNDVGAPNEYFSGVSTKPQVTYIENPESGNWEVKVYGWNLRPKNDPNISRPTSQDVDIDVYMGNDTDIIKNPTVISSDASINSAKNFVDNLKGDDQATYIAFGSYGELIQPLTFDKDALKTAIDNTGREGGTAIQTGINEAKLELNNSRGNSTKIMIILTDGQNDQGPSVVIDAANQAKSEGITIFTIGLTGFVNHEMLESVASKPQYYFYTPDASGLDEIYETISQTIQSSFVSFIDDTYETCYLGPEYIMDIYDELSENNILFYYVNKVEGLCENENMKNMASETGGKFYTYTEAGGLNDIILDLTHVITKTYERFEKADKLKIIFYNDTIAYEKDISNPPHPLTTDIFEIPDLGSHITNINKIEIYLIIITDSGKEIVSPPMDVWEVH